MRGIIHVGANLCQEFSLYTTQFNIPSTQIVWIEAIPKLVNFLQATGMKNVYQTVLDKESGEVEFLVTNNNGESSSVLELNTHKDLYPHIVVVEKISLKSETLEHFITTNCLPEGCLDFLVMDIQGNELRVLSGSPEVLKNVKMIRTEVLIDELYHGAGVFKDLNSFLESHNFICVRKEINAQNWGDALYIRKDLLIK